MSGQRTLTRAARLLRSHRFSQVITLLEPQVFLYRENSSFFSMLGTACLYVGDFGGAYSYLLRAEQLRPGDGNVSLGLAAVHLRRKEIPEALQRWLTVLESDPKNSAARRGLSLVRQTEDPGDYVTMAESGRLRLLFPRVGPYIPGWVYIVVVVCAVVVPLALILPDMIRNALQEERPVRDGSAEFVEPQSDLTDFEGEFRYVMSEEQVRATFDRIGELFNDYRDNMAMREVNRLLNSNAGSVVKERSRLLATYFGEPTFLDFRDNFSYSEVASEPWLHDGCYVRWSGQVSNLTITESTIEFVLLVGYEDEKVVEGTVPVVLTFAADVQAGPIELIGRVTLDGTKVAIEATSIRRLAPTAE